MRFRPWTDSHGVSEPWSDSHLGSPFLPVRRLSSSSSPFLLPSFLPSFLPGPEDQGPGDQGPGASGLGDCFRAPEANPKQDHGPVSGLPREP